MYRENSKMIHLRSLSNFVHTLTSAQDTDSKNNSNRVALSRVRKKELTLEYLKQLEEEKRVTDDLSDKYFNEYIKPLGNYMSSYHKFSYIGWRSIPFKICLISDHRNCPGLSSSTNHRKVGLFYYLNFNLVLLQVLQKISAKESFWIPIYEKEQCTTTYKNNAKTCLESKLRARLLRLIFLRKIMLAISHCFYTRRCSNLKNENQHNPLRQIKH